MFEPSDKKFSLRSISLGAGVQSTAVALLAARGIIGPMPDCAIFADTGAEPQKVYEHLQWLESVLPYPVYRVMESDGLDANIIASVNGGRFAGAPFFTESDRGGGMLRRQCTSEFKIRPIQQKLRELMGVSKGARVGSLSAETWIGISMDEIQRAKPSRDKWETKRFPLIELRWTRADCLKWLESEGYPRPPRSACVWCPYHSDAEWKDIRDNDPESWERALTMDDLIRGGVRGTEQKLFLHKSLLPLRDADLRSAEDCGQLTMWDNECEGMCGT
jgi:3'-phosphoadenosine 5'-phosphosulfate sulfotransferase (PAPS reductase)/FAD synthetase